MSFPKVRFKEDTHEYFLKDTGEKVPSVSEIIRPAMGFDFTPKELLEAASSFGRNVHRLVELDTIGCLDESTVDSYLLPYLRAWRLFCFESDASFYPESIELPVYSSLGYAGQPDCFGLVGGANVIVDIKTSATAYPWVGLQLAAYANALRENINFEADELCAVLLRDNGTYAIARYTDPLDWKAFQALLLLRLQSTHPGEVATKASEAAKKVFEAWCTKNKVTPSFNELGEP